MSNRPIDGDAVFDIGIYTYGEAAKLLKVNSINLRRWVEGYVFYRNGEARSSEPVVASGMQATGLLTFHDLIELFFVREFRLVGVPLPDIRRDAKELRQQWNTKYPFAQKRIVELNKQLVDNVELHTIFGKQQVFEFGKVFFRNIDFDASDLARSWHPLGKDKLVVLDPTRSFGAPIEIRSGIRTEVLYKLYVAEQDIDAVADWYEVAREGVEQSVQFEESCRPIAA